MSQSIETSQNGNDHIFSRINPPGFQSMVIQADQVMGEYLNELLIKTHPSNTVVWIPKADVEPRHRQKGLKIKIYHDLEYSTARLQIANSIRLFLSEHKMVKGKELLL